jgi:hypothetical protein
MSIIKKKTTMRAFACFSLWLVLLLPITACKSSKSSNANPTISISPGAAVLSAAQTQQFTATVTNASNTRVTWSIVGCSVNVCGTISSAGLYTAPPVIYESTAVIIAAVSQANSAKSSRTSITLLPLTVAIPNDDIVLGAGESHQYAATVMRHFNTAVAWTLPGCTGINCGTISNSGLYTSPSSIPSDTSTQVMATSLADPTKSAQISVYLRAISVSVAPPSRVIPPGTARDFTATVQYDIKKAGVTWSLGAGCTAAKCGTLANVSPTSVTYTAPAESSDPSQITLYAKSVTDPSKTSVVAFAISTVSQLKEGDYAFFFQGHDSVGTVSIAGRFHTDGSGNITDGVEDINLKSGVSQSVPFTGTCKISASYLGILTLSADNGTSTFYISVDPAGTKGRFIKFDALPEESPIFGSGYFEMQDKAAFSQAVLAGPFAIGIYNDSIASVGRLSIDATGAGSDGLMDVAVSDLMPKISTNLTLNGSMSEPSLSTGRGTASFSLNPSPEDAASSLNFAYYIISDQKILLVRTDAREPGQPALGGEMRRQNGTFSANSFNAPTIFGTSGTSWIGTLAAIGRMVPDGAGSVTGVIDAYESMLPDSLNKEFFGDYVTESNGRSVINLESSLGKQTYIAYFFGQNRGFLMPTTHAVTSFGEFGPQTSQPFTAASISGTFLVNTLKEPSSKEISGLTTFDETGIVNASLDVTDEDIEDETSEGPLSHIDLSGTYSVALNGRGTIAFDSPTKRATVFWIISATEMVGISPDDLQPRLVEYRR